MTSECWISRSCRVVRALSSRGRSNTHRPALSVPYVIESAYVGWERLARRTHDFVVLDGILGHCLWTLGYAELQRINYWTTILNYMISKWASYFFSYQLFFVAAMKRFPYRSYCGVLLPFDVGFLGQIPLFEGRLHQRPSAFISVLYPASNAYHGE